MTAPMPPEQPRPSESPNRTMPNLIVAPHVSGPATESCRSAVGSFCRNLGPYLDGTPGRMGNLVDHEAVR
jgi:phosphoglycerate dehydrogenase-like enzyme